LPVTEEEMGKILEEMRELVEKFCGGEISQFVLNRGNPEMEF